MNRNVRKVFKACEQTAMVTNVRDAVSALGQETQLSKTVPWFGDRSLAGNFGLAFFKAKRSRQELDLLKLQRYLLEQAKIGTSNISYVPATANGQGIVSALSDWRSDRLSELVKGRKMQFFYVTPQAEELASKAGTTVYGPNAKAAKDLNDKIVQRELAKALREKIFPEHEIAGSEQAVLRAYRRFRDNGYEACIKVGHLASGEGMLKNPPEERTIADFWRKWSRNLREHGYEEKLLVERWHGRSPSCSTQYFIDEKGQALYLGSSYQHIGADGVSHKGNVIGADIGSLVSPQIESELRRKSEALFACYPGSAYFANFDFIYADGEVLATEMNLRWTATTVLYSISAQMDNGQSHCYNLIKLELGRLPKMSAAAVLRLLLRFNNREEGILPLTIRYFEETGEAFLVAYAPSYLRTESILSNFKSRL